MKEAAPPNPALAEGTTIEVPDIFSRTPPKGFTPGTNLMQTQQSIDLVQRLKDRKGKSGVSDNLIILSGPSGIGKSCLTLMAAAHMKMEEQENVLYVPDAGELLARATRDGERPVQALLVEYLLQLARDQNPNVLPEVKGKLTMRALVQLLNAHHFIIFLDGQGRAFMELERRGDHHTLGMIYPNHYIVGGQQLRVVLAGSNHASFETSLNGEYLPCLRYVQPMANEEAAAFNHRFGMNLTAEDMNFYCSNVPKEMQLLSEAVASGHTREDHWKDRCEHLQQVLVQAFAENKTPRWLFPR